MPLIRNHSFDAEANAAAIAQIAPASDSETIFLDSVFIEIGRGVNGLENE